MAFSGLLALLDDVSALADDVATLTLAASKKTTGLVTDDMAVTAQQAVGLSKDRELPVVWKVARGSLFNKGIILVPAALVLNALVPWILTPLLMAGGTYLCFEGVEKILHKVQHPKDHEKTHASPAAGVDPETFERQRVQGAIRTDLILSAEIVAITLGEVKDADFWTQVAVLYVVAVAMTVGVYGMVALLVRLDDLGAALVQADAGFAGLGRAILKGTPYLMKGVSWVGTIAMVLVGGQIILHGITPLATWVHDGLHGLHLPGAVETLATLGVDFAVGLVAGSIALAIWRALPFDDEPKPHDVAHPTEA
ncbi:MAG: DUF808 domain-containing protein [Myxococcota bacterium]